ncbi:MAG: TIGR02281 family clan AA aspartic protease [Sphingomonas sp.]|nr:TIGR02281 family clan AA aspartic protease [Sphingomonas sp.]
MTDDQQMSVLWYVLILLLPLSALLARRIPIGHVVRTALMWVGIFAVGLILATLWTRNRGAVDGFLADAGLTHSVVTGRNVEVPRGVGGHFWIEAEINGVNRRMLIDTGATQTSISRETARAAGIVVEDGFGVMVETANGTTINQRARIAQLRIGPITARDMPVLVGDTLGDDLLGIDFLNQLKSWRADGNRLVLEPRAR